MGVATLSKILSNIKELEGRSPLARRQATEAPVVPESLRQGVRLLQGSVGSFDGVESISDAVWKRGAFRITIELSKFSPERQAQVEKGLRGSFADLLGVATAAGVPLEVEFKSVGKTKKTTAAPPAPGSVSLQPAELPASAGPAIASLPGATVIESGYDLAPDEARFLAAHGTQPSEFRETQRQVREGTFTAASSIYTGELRPPNPEDVSALPSVGSADHLALTRLGEDALKKGLVARVIYGGGMATRFGGGVKGTVDVLPNESFLQLMIADARAAGRKHGATVPVVIMSTELATPIIKQHLIDHGLWGPDIIIFEQGLSARLNPDGSVYRGPDGKPSYYPPGHGDFFRAFRDSGTLQALRDRGIKYMLTSNVDNLGATLDPAVIGHHIRSGKQMTSEVVSRDEADNGSAVIRAGGRPYLLEGFRFPEDVDRTPYRDFAINNHVYSLDAPALDVLGGEVPLPRHLVSKTVDGKQVFQVEVITHEATQPVGPDGQPIISLNLLRVPREGQPGDFFAGRFYPVKDRANLKEVSGKLALARVRELFLERFPGHTQGLWLNSASGRINLIGEHTDYAGGFSLPAAINLRIRGAFEPIPPGDPDAGKIIIHSQQGEGVAEFSINDIPTYPKGDWRNYIASSVKMLRERAKERGIELTGMRAVIDSDIPAGSGMSSSAALELLTMNSLCHFSGLSLDPTEMALLGRDAEWDTGVHCGIMDQMAIAHGGAGTAIFLDARNQTARSVPINIGDYQFVVGFTMPRTLNGSPFDDRVREVQEAANELARLSGLDIRSLRDVEPALLEKYRDQLDPLLYQRARHVVGEQARVTEAIEALGSGDIARFNELLKQTHDSLRDDYQVSSPELDAMVEAARAFGAEHGVSIGARMMGAGFGGSTLLVVPKSEAAEFKAFVAERYRAATGSAGRFWDVSIEDGLRTLAPASLVVEAS